MTKSIRGHRTPRRPVDTKLVDLALRLKGVDQKEDTVLVNAVRVIIGLNPIKWFALWLSARIIFQKTDDSYDDRTVILEDRESPDYHCREIQAELEEARAEISRLRQIIIHSQGYTNLWAERALRYSRERIVLPSNPQHDKSVTDLDKVEPILEYLEARKKELESMTSALNGTRIPVLSPHTVNSTPKITTPAQGRYAAR